MSEWNRELPAVALRGMTILPGMIIHFDVSRPKSIKAIEQAMLLEQQIFLVTQMDVEDEDPVQESLYKIGVIASVKQVIKLQQGMIRVLVEGIQRGELMQFLEQKDFLLAEVKSSENMAGAVISSDIEEAMIRGIRETIISYVAINPKIGKELVKRSAEIQKADGLLDYLGNHMPLGYEQKQKILETIDVQERYEVVLSLLLHEIHVTAIKNEFQAKVKEKIDKNQKEYILREQMKLIRKELGGEEETEEESHQFLEEVEKLKASKTVKEKLKKEIKRFQSISSHSSESAVLRGYIETMLELPWNKMSKDNKDLDYAEKILNRDHYGLEKVKKRVLEFLAVRNLTGKGDSPILCLVGPPGTGKTSIAKSIATALDKKYVRMSLGGVRDEAEIRGHRKTYVGAMPGRIVTSLKQAGVKNPLILLDEIDKVSKDYKGDTASALLEVLDPEQNHKFQDHYVELPVDLSEVFFIATANSTSDIPRPLLDRMELIEVTSYTENEKLHIASEYLIEKQFKKNGLKMEKLSISNKALLQMIRGYTKEAGVRNLERKIGEICRQAAREIYNDKKKTIKVTNSNLEKYLGKERYHFEMANQEHEVGIVRGLAWTSMGGDTLQIEVNIVPGKGEVQLTGQMGDVMKESAMTGISYIRSIASGYQVEKEFFKENDFHIHIPEGAVPKDGPSAGITMATALLSAILKRKVRKDVAMTGEITLRGRVLPIGGLKEKILAAKNAQMKIVCIPKKNQPDVSEISEEIKKGIRIVYVENMEEVLETAFVEEAKI